MLTHLDTLLAAFDDTLPLARAKTIPAAWYTDPSIHQAERSRLFGRCWLWAGREEQVARPGTFFTLDIAGEPIVVVRGEDGVVRAFHNVCRHRAARVVCGAAGCTSRLRCRYHGWSYDLAGQLRGAPEYDGVEDFRREEHGLLPLTTGLWGGFVWVHQGTPEIPLEEWVAPLQRRGFANFMAPLKYVGRREYPLACNWKVFCDNYLDGGYHINTVHPDLASVLDYSRYRTEIDGHASVQISPLTSRGANDSVAAVRGVSGNAYYAWVFPNLMLNYYDGIMDINIVLPEGPDRCRVLFDFYFANTEGEEARKFIEQSMAVTDQVQKEDGDVCEEVQRNLGSCSYDTARFSVKREGSNYHFQQMVARWLKGEQAKASRAR